MRIVFQGDSITDAGRDRSDPGSFGNGYVLKTTQALGSEITCLNRGISGNRVYDLEARWQADCLDLNPDIVTILIGINDTWRRFDSNTASPIDDFEQSLARICEACTYIKSKLILLEPFLLPVPEDRLKWRTDLDPRIQAVRRVASRFADRYVPLDGLFAAATCRSEAAELAQDGVHPSDLGHQLISDHLLHALQEIL